MKEYKFTFTGKLNGAIGAFCGFSKSVFADDLEKAILKLYDTHEHISKLHYWDGAEYFPVSNLYLDKKEGRDQNGFV
jgi:hypothetical protein